MNSELQAQSDAITGAIRHLETAMHQDFVLVGSGLGVFLIILIFVTILKR